MEVTEECKALRLRFTEWRANKIRRDPIPEELKKETVRLYKSGVKIALLRDFLGLSGKSISTWVNQYADNLGEEEPESGPTEPESPEVVAAITPEETCKAYTQTVTIKTGFKGQENRVYAEYGGFVVDVWIDPDAETIDLINPAMVTEAIQDVLNQLFRQIRRLAE